MTATTPTPVGAPFEPPPIRSLHDEARAAVWRDAGASPDAVTELLAYARNTFVVPTDVALPLRDEPFVAAWSRYAEEAEVEGADVVLRRALVQLRFPIEAGISETERYRASTRRGIAPSADEVGVAFVRGAAIRIVIHETAAGRVPLVITEAREDFETLVRALTCRNEPVAVAKSQGACIVAGYNNWSRVAEMRAEWEDSVATPTEAGWADAFRAIVPQKERYQDRFIILSRGPYSATDASALDLDVETWLDASLVIRRDHECAHYFTRRVFGSMSNTLFDEMLADYAGIVAAEGRYRADWFLRFMGAERAGTLREFGRLANYRGTPPLSDEAFVVLQRVLRNAAENLEVFDARARAENVLRDTSLHAIGRTLMALAHVGLETLGTPAGASVLRDVFDVERMRESSQKKVLHG